MASKGHALRAGGRLPLHARAAAILHPVRLSQSAQPRLAQPFCRAGYTALLQCETQHAQLQVSPNPKAGCYQESTQVAGSLKQVLDAGWQVVFHRLWQLGPLLEHPVEAEVVVLLHSAAVAAGMRLG